jgi:hypothetical protein
MYLFIKTLTWDADEPIELARFWAAVLGSDIDEDSTPDKVFLEAPAWGGPSMWFNRASGPKVARNRLHIDLRALTSMDVEVGRLTDLGATVREREGAITRLYDPEGNEFCVEASPDEHNSVL